MSAARLAEMLATSIGARKLPSGRVMRAGDILILLRRRDRYYRLVLTALQQAGVRVAGADRMKLEEQIEIRDLLALGDVMLLPEDDLQLAALLKSPCSTSMKRRFQACAWPGPADASCAPDGTCRRA